MYMYIGKSAMDNMSSVIKTASPERENPLPRAVWFDLKINMDSDSYIEQIKMSTFQSKYIGCTCIT